MNRCIDCAKPAPETHTPFTLIGAAHGWRCSRGRELDGKPSVELRCRECWKKYKALVGSPAAVR
jgi:hypothetical protein